MSTQLEYQSKYQRTDDERDLQFPDTIADRNKLGGTPDQALLLDRADRLLELGHVRLVVPRLDLERDNRLGNCLGFVGLARIVLGYTLSLDTLSLFVLFVVLSKEINILIVVSTLVNSES
jgi:hypothetical protein